MWAIIAAFLLIIVFCIVLLLRRCRYNSTMQKYYEAARRIIQEDYLNYSLKNPTNMVSRRPGVQKNMVGIQFKTAKKNKYVFDPEKDIYIGRNSEGNEIVLTDITVSGKHCLIFEYHGQICIKNFSAVNGTIVKRGFRLVRLKQNDVFLLKNGDEIRVGSTVFRIYIFFCDSL